MEIFNDILGMKINIPDEPNRIVSLAPSITETLFMLGLDERIVAVSYFCNKPEEAKNKPRVGSYMHVNMEKLVALEPDLVLTTTGAQRETNKKLIEKGIPVFPIPLPTSAYGILENVWIIGNLTNKIEKAREIIDNIVSVIAEISKNRPNYMPRVYWEIDLGGPITAGAPSYIDSGFTLAGAKNIFGNKRLNYFKPDFNEVKKLDPEIIIYESQPGKKVEVEDVKNMANERGWNTVKAVKDGKIFVVPPDSFAHYGPSFFDVVKWLNDLIIRIFH